MKALRRSLKGEKSDVRPNLHHVSVSQKDAIAILPPKKVIRALYDHEATHEHELSFSKGDFFHVIGRENDPDWYEACNPSMPNARGLVPVQFFQVLGKTERDSAGSSLSGSKVGDGDAAEGDRARASAVSSSSHARAPSATGTARTSSGPHKNTGAMVYGVVIYDFTAERPDELDAKAGEAIIVIAQSNPEWFVAKPIGRLGGPGLIPVSFIQIRDMATGEAVHDPHEAVQRAGVPKVEEWKKMAADYKNSSISLGKFESGPSQRMPQPHMDRASLNGATNYAHNLNGHTNGQVRSSQQQRYLPVGSKQLDSHQYSRPSSSQQPQQPHHHQQHQQQQLLAPISATIPRWYFAREKYWYVLDAIMEDGRHWELSRAYQDFYDFQIALLSEFPEEAGNAGKPRSLPFMPGPVTYVTDQISNMRRESLDDYIKKLLAMSSYISRCSLIRQLFAPREGDFLVDSGGGGGGGGDGGGGDDAHVDSTNYGRLSGASQPSSTASAEAASRQSSRGNLNGGGGSSMYQQPGLSAPPPARSAHHAPHHHPHHQRQQSSFSNGVAQVVHYRSASSSDNPHVQLHQPPQQAQPRPGVSRQVSSLTQGSTGSLATTAATGTPNTNSGGSGSGAMKIKIYFQDDLIAIRVPTDVTFAQLRDKLQTRLNLVGPGATAAEREAADIRIQYKDEPSGTYEPLRNDDDLNVALQRNSKLALYVNRY